MVGRLQACAAGKPLPDSAEVPMLDEMTRKAQEKLLIAQVVREIQSSLGQIEQALDTFFREPDQKDQLAACHKPVKQIVGALSILGQIPGRYHVYVRDVRLDYAHVDDGAWRVGRASVLRHLLGLEPLFRTGPGRELWEPRARRNLADELAALES